MRLRLITWNVAEKGPPKKLNELLGLDDRTLPDLYAIGLQELPSSPKDLFRDVIKDDNWSRKIGSALFKIDFVRVKTIRLLGMHLSVYTKRQHMFSMTNIEAKYTRTGFGGTWGNKGGVTIRLDVYGVNMCFVNCHLTAHLPNYYDRIQDYDDILKQQFCDECSNILDNDYVFWMGDLNFRIENQSKVEIEEKTKQKDYKTLLKDDQLQKAMKEEYVLLDFVEGEINFPPTYKFDINSNNYDTSVKQRKPAYCDRILYMVHEDSFTGLNLTVTQHSYTSLMSYTNSDHKPVLSDFDIVVLDSPPEMPVMFEPVGVWWFLRNGKCSYTVNNELDNSSWDWIGLYRHNFQHVKDYVTYVYASTNGEEMKDQDCELFNLKIGKEYLSRVGDYYLGYYSAKKGCVVGFSNLFTVSLLDESSDSDDDYRDRKKRK